MIGAQQTMHDWRKAVRTPISYSVPGSTSTLLRQQTNFVTFVIVTGAFVLLTLYTFTPQPRPALNALDDEHGHEHTRSLDCRCAPEDDKTSYNRTYPLTPIETLSDGRLKYHIAAVADLDKNSRLTDKSNTWTSYMLRGNLILDIHSNTVEVNWESEEQELLTGYSASGRGNELSDLVVFNGKLYSCDDRTGIVYEVRNSQLFPWVILLNGDGQSTIKGFKCEWMVVKDEELFVGGLGKEWTTTNGEVILNHDPQWVKRITPQGLIEHLDWRLRYIELRRAAGIDPPGYLIHEAVVWSKKAKRWYFLPRRASKQVYNELFDEQRGTNILLSADSNFHTVNKTGTVGSLVKTHGFSSFKLLPLPAEVVLQPEGSELAIALKSEEDNDIISTYVMVFRLPDGHILYPETKISSKHKYEVYIGNSYHKGTKVGIIMTQIGNYTIPKPVWPTVGHTNYFTRSFMLHWIMIVLLTIIVMAIFIECYCVPMFFCADYGLYRLSWYPYYYSQRYVPLFVTESSISQSDRISIVTQSSVRIVSPSASVCEKSLKFISRSYP